MPRIVRFIEQESGMVVPILEGREIWEEGHWELLVNGCRLLVLQDEKALEMDSGDGGTTLLMCLTLLSCAFKHAWLRW